MDLSVQHCNARTEYVMIAHEFDPDTCDECKRTVAICGGDIEVTKIEIDLLNRDSRGK